MVRQKRYQFINSKGEKEWTPWFNYNGPEEPHQLDKKLKNEYRTINQ